MAVTGLAEGVGLLSSLASSLLGGIGKKKQIERQNEINRQNWEQAFQVTRDQLSIAYNRTQIGVSEINRDRLRNKMAVRRASIKAKGTASVKAAQLGISGRRGSRVATQDIQREEAQAISDIDVSAEVEFTNAVNAFNDAAFKAINNLNSHSPLAVETPSTMDLVTGTLNSGINYYQGLSQAQQANLDNVFNFDSTTDIAPPQFSTGARTGGF